MARLFAVVAVLCLSLFNQSCAQRTYAKHLALPQRQARLQSEDLVEIERQKLLQNPTGPAAVTLGDSITAFGYNEDGWVSLLAKDYPQMTFVNRGLAMGNSRSSLILSNWTTADPGSPLYKQASRIKLVTICFGANDAAINIRNATWRLVPLAEYKSNIEQSIITLRAANVANIVLMTPPPAASPPRIDRALSATEEYAEVCHQIGLEQKVPVVDIFNAIQAVPDWKETAMLKDGLHLSPVGHRVVHDRVHTTLRQNYFDL